MVTIASLNAMYDMFIDNSCLTTKELLSIGFTSKDLTRLKENGKITSTSRGVYTLGDVGDLYTYAYNLSKEQRAKKNAAFLRCFEMQPYNKRYVLVTLYSAIWEKDYDLVFRCIDVLDKDADEFYSQDYNLYLLLLSYITEIPERYKERVKNISSSDILISQEDSRYPKNYLANVIRMKTIDARFNDAAGILTATSGWKSKKVSASLLYKLLYTAEAFEKKKKLNYFNLIKDGNYKQLVKDLDNEKSVHCLGFVERNLYILACDMLGMKQSGRFPQFKRYDGTSFEKAIDYCDYNLALKLIGSSDIKSPELKLMLEKIIEEIDQIKITRSNSATVQRKVVDLTEIRKYLLENNFDLAFGNLDIYLKSNEKSRYRSYIASLIKLDLLKKDMSFTDSIAALANIDCDSFEFDTSSYFRNFYLSIADKDFKRATVYLDILSCSEDLCGVFFDTTNMRCTLENEIKTAGMETDVEKFLTGNWENIVSQNSQFDNSGENVLEVAISENAMVESTPVVETIGDSDIRKEELAASYCQLTDVIDRVINGDNVVLLEPMNDEDTENVLYIASCVPDVAVSLADSTDGQSKHVVLRYIGRSNQYIPRGETIRAANAAYRRNMYGDCVELLESVLPSIAAPRSFIYKKLGLSYAKLVDDGDYHDTIDYLTLATSVSKSESVYACDFSKEVEDLKKRTGYNGVRVKLDNGERSDILVGSKNAKGMELEKKI